ncbi:MAG: hypothetical protein [Circular genetic element sp.]|nr:MAG: hypothetical protein [Circular genetic element sp.]
MPSRLHTHHCELGEKYGGRRAPRYIASRGLGPGGPTCRAETRHVLGRNAPRMQLSLDLPFQSRLASAGACGARDGVTCAI